MQKKNYNKKTTLKNLTKHKPSNQRKHKTHIKKAYAKSTQNKNVKQKKNKKQTHLKKQKKILRKKYVGGVIECPPGSIAAVADNGSEFCQPQTQKPANTQHQIYEFAGLPGTTTNYELRQQVVEGHYDLGGTQNIQEDNRASRASVREIGNDISRTPTTPTTTATTAGTPEGNLSVVAPLRNVVVNPTYGPNFNDTAKTKSSANASESTPSPRGVVANPTYENGGNPPTSILSGQEPGASSSDFGCERGSIENDECVCPVGDDNDNDKERAIPEWDEEHQTYICPVSEVSDLLTNNYIRNIPKNKLIFFKYPINYISRIIELLKMHDYKTLSEVQKENYLTTETPFDILMRSIEELNYYYFDLENQSNPELSYLHLVKYNMEYNEEHSTPDTIYNINNIIINIMLLYLSNFDNIYPEISKFAYDFYKQVFIDEYNKGIYQRLDTETIKRIKNAISISHNVYSLYHFKKTIYNIIRENVLANNINNFFTPFIMSSNNIKNQASKKNNILRIQLEDNKFEQFTKMLAYSIFNDFWSYIKYIIELSGYYRHILDLINSGEPLILDITPFTEREIFFQIGQMKIFSILYTKRQRNFNHQIKYPAQRLFKRFYNFNTNNLKEIINAPFHNVANVKAKIKHKKLSGKNKG